jgi:hypothetical protein
MFIHRTLNIAKKTFIPHHNGNRFNRDSQDLSLYQYLKDGKGSFSTFSANSPSPSYSTVCRLRKKEKDPITVGEVNVGKIVEFLTKRNYSLTVFVACDDTRIETKVNWNADDNKIYGFVGPIHQVTGFPVTSSFEANTPGQVLELMNNTPLAKYLEVFTLTSFTPGATSTVIAAIPTDRKYKKADKLRQFMYLKNLLGMEGVKIDSVASDGDERSMGAQKALISYGHIEIWHGAKLYGDSLSETGAVQDYVHMLNKLRWRIFNENADLVIGDFEVNIKYLCQLLSRPDVSFDTFKLTMRELEVKNMMRDKMSYEITCKLMNPKIIFALEEHVHGGLGLAHYLRMMMLLRDACVLDETEITVEQRIMNMIYVSSCLRRWRQDIIEKSYLKASNFISTNSWCCVELNLVFLVRLIRSGRGDLVYLVNSQPCENVFRLMRSSTPKHSTMVNVTTKTAVERIDSLNLLLDTTAKLNQRGMNFKEHILDQVAAPTGDFIPRFLSDTEIDEIVQSALGNAKRDMGALGIFSEECNVNEILHHGSDLESLMTQNIPATSFGVVNFPDWNIIRRVVDGKNIVSLGPLHFLDEIQEKSQFTQIKSFNPWVTESISKSQFLNRVNGKKRDHVNNDINERFRS